MAAKESELAGGEVSCLFSTRAEFDFISLLFTFCIQKPLAFFFFFNWQRSQCHERDENSCVFIC